MQPGKIQVSIITPVYNAEKFIERCVESVQRQGHSSYEHLIIDGNSTDNTVALVRKYMSADANIRLVTEKDEGVYDAMNKAVLLAEGQWLYFLGADDYFYSDKILARIALTLSSSHAEIVYGNVWLEQSARIYDGVFGIEKLLKRNICHQAIFYRSSVFATMGLYNTDYTQEGDYEFNLRCWIKGAVVSKFINETIAFYSKGGISSFQKDSALVKDFPDIVIGYLFESKRSFFSKVNILSKVFRKIFLRYGVKKFGIVFLKNNNYRIKILAFAWMIISFPVYFINSFIFARK
ncbi:MAG: glycosyltransferase family 2 protein [Ginsengibacter sp.]